MTIRHIVVTRRPFRAAVWTCDRCGLEVPSKSATRVRRDGLRLCMACKDDAYYIRRATA